jgi:7-cyano-7-deazaguanine synthase in queuosine biosynthesis
MSYQIIRREAGGLFTARCACGSIQSVGPRRIKAGRCQACERRHAAWQAELMAPFGKRPVAR